MIDNIRQNLLVHEAKRWLRFTEKGGDNKGQVVEMFQKHVDGKAQGEPWCMSFAQFCVSQTDMTIDAIMMNSSENRSIIYSSEHCLTVWNKSPKECQFETPKLGSLMIWQHGSSSSGHVGIVVCVESSGEYVWTVEGNTGPQEAVNRDGDGVYLKKRKILNPGKMKVVGWLDPWGAK